MGLFSSSKRTYVSSVVYNMAGPEDDRANYLKTLVISNTISDYDTSMSNTITEGYLNGPGIKLRNFTRWAKSSGYSALLELQEGDLTGQDSINPDDVSPHIPHSAQEEVVIETAEIGMGNLSYWVDRYMLDNHPNRMNEDYVSDYNDDVVTITFPNNDIVSFNVTGFSSTNRYLYVSYKLVEKGQNEPVEEGAVTTLPEGASFPDMSGWNQVHNNSTDTNVSLVTSVNTTVTYSDDRPDENSTDTSSTAASYTNSNTLWDKTEYQGIDEAYSESHSIYYTEEHIQTGQVVQVETTDTQTETIEDDVTKTTTIVTTVDTIQYVRTRQQNTQKINIQAWSGLKVFIYANNGSNPALNALFNSTTSMGDFFPFIPIRESKEFLSPDYFGSIYTKSKYAMRKAVGGNYDNIIDEIADNESIDDIDYAYTVFGVSLNVKENACRKYIYNFFTAIRENNDLDSSIATYEAWRNQWEIVNSQRQHHNTWLRAQREPENALYGTEEPPLPAYPQPPSGKIALIASGPIKFEFEISWNYIREITGVGKLREDKRQGDLWFVEENSEDYIEVFTSGAGELESFYRVDVITLYWQVTNQSWRAITIAGLKHINHVYRGHYNDIHAIDALNDPEESGFIIPLHDGIYRTMSLKDATQMSTACSFLVFNSYKEVRKKWYQTGAFKVFIVIAAIAISVYFPPAGGILGSAAKVGASLGFSGITAVIVGTIANAIAAIIITEIIQRGATALLGDKIGSIVGTIASVVAITVGSAYLNGSSVATGFTSLTRADNLLRLTNAVGEGYVGYLQGTIAESQTATQALLEEYAKTSEQINTQYEKLFGNSGGIIDTSILTQSAQQGYHHETGTEFIDRTLMLGSDIAELSIRLLDNFVEITINTDLK